MTDEEFLDAQRKQVLEFNTEVIRLLRSDANIMESVHDIIVTARDEIRKHPKLFFIPQAPIPPTDQTSLPEADITGGQVWAGPGGIPFPKPPPPEPTGPGWIDLVKTEKDFIGKLVPKLPGGGKL